MNLDSRPLVAWLGLWLIFAIHPAAMTATDPGAGTGPAGVIDISFGDNTQQPGRVLTDFRALANGSRSADFTRAIAIQADGKIVVAGYSDSPNGDNNFALVRYHPNGVIDTSFGDNTQQPGRVLTDFRPFPNGRRSDDQINALALQADGKIVAAGTSRSPNGDYNFALVRYHPNGVIDTSFGDSTLDPGRVLTDFRPLPDGRRSTDEILAIAILPDGKIVAGGYSNSPNGDRNFALVRYHPNGVIDTSFGDSTLDPGRVLTDFRAIRPDRRSNDQVHALAIQADGKIVAAGHSDSPNDDRNFALVRYHPNGVIDTSFGDNTQQPGRVLTDFRPLQDGRRTDDQINALALQADGKIVVAGRSDSPNGDINFALVRYSINGVIDTTFGDNTQQPGRVLTDFRALPNGFRSNDQINALALQADGKIVVGGRSESPNGDRNFALIRYSADGIIDTAFGDSTLDPGRVLTDFRAHESGRRSDDEIHALAILPNGKIVVAGQSDSPNGDFNFALVRYHGAPTASPPPGDPPPPATTGKINLNLTLSATQVRGGSAVKGTVTLSRPAPAGGVKLIAYSDDPDVASDSDPFLIPAGMSSGTFTITTFPVAFEIDVGIYVEFEDLDLPIAGEPDHVVLIVTP